VKQNVQPGESTEISAVVNVPQVPGRYAAYFRLADGERNTFGMRFWVEFVVPGQREGEDKDAQKPKETVVVTSPVVDEEKSATPKVVAPSSTPAPSKYDNELNALALLGFPNRELNIYLLNEHKGNLQEVANFLLEEAKAKR
jgi:hypothetical protein